MSPAETTITVTVAPHWVNGWFLRAGARPVVQVDGEDHVGRWGRPLTLTLRPGQHEVRAFFRYRGRKPDVGAARRDIDLAAGDSWHLIARHGASNSSGLRFTEVARA